MRVVVAFSLKLAKHRTHQVIFGDTSKTENQMFYLRSKILEKPRRNFRGMNFLQGLSHFKTVKLLGIGRTGDWRGHCVRCPTKEVQA